MVWQAGTQLKGGYIIEKQIGDGGFGLTYLGYKSDRATKVAIKTLKDEYASIEDWQDEFRREAMSLSKCNHPQIVKIYDINLHESGFLRHRKQWFMVMEYIKGKTILEKMQTWEQQGYDPRFSENEALRYIRQIAKALVFAHDRHPPILHRDLKPQNIMLRGDRDEAVLIDFGLAREFADAPVITTKIMVSNGFAPIEQYSFNPIRQAATDVYSLAATLYYMVTNQLPTNANDRAQRDVLPSPQEYASISDATCDAILNGLAFLASDRPQTMQEWLDLLDEANRENANIYFEQALEKQYKGNSQGALDDYNTVISINPELADAYYYRAIVKTILDDKKGAISDYNYVKKIASSTISELEYENRSIVENCLMSQYDENYEKLEYFLRRERWLEANSQTIGLLLLIADNNPLSLLDDYKKMGVEFDLMRNFYRKGWLHDRNLLDDINKEKFLEIDKLWVKYSQSTLGFSIQYPIVKSYFSSDDFDSRYTRPAKLGRALGWYFGVEQEIYPDFDWRYWVNYKTINWVNPTKILGHLPYLGHSWLASCGPIWTSYYDFMAAREYSYMGYSQENIDEKQENHDFHMNRYALCDVVRLLSNIFGR
jgi:serine/threonine protein kinase